MASNVPILVLSQDYELFFQRSGTVEKCLFEPCDALLAMARKLGLKVTFFVDAGMIVCMERFAASNRDVARMVAQVKNHVATLAAAGHEIALHVHPHWQDSRWHNGASDFSSTRFQLRDFSREEIADIFTTYSNCLGELSGQRPSAYRAGGFCVEPFDRIGPALTQVGISIDSSVVPGAWLQDQDKGFDFRRAPDDEWWFFDDSPTVPSANGRFLELPITPQRLPVYYYWKLIPGKIWTRGPSQKFGDGAAKKPGTAEIARRLAGLSRNAELSIDHAQSDYLLADRNRNDTRGIWQVMGHPKMMSHHSLAMLEAFVKFAGIQGYETVTSAAGLVRSGEWLAKR